MPHDRNRPVIDLEDYATISLQIFTLRQILEIVLQAVPYYQPY